MALNQVDIRIDFEENEERNPVISESLTPVLFLLKCFGLYFDTRDGKTALNRWVNRFLKMYCYFVFFAFFTVIWKGVAALFYQEGENGYYFAAILIVYNIKCTFQIYACLKLASCSTSQKLLTYTKGLEAFLTKVKLQEYRKQENYFKHGMKRWLFFLLLIMLLELGTVIFFGFYPINSLEYMLSQFVRPLPGTMLTKSLTLLQSSLSIGIWILPVALCNILIQSLSYVLSEFYRHLQHKEKTKLCLRTYIKDMREKYVTMSTICSNLDDMLSWLFMTSYLTDIVLICLLLRVMVINVEDVYSRLVLVSWLIPCVLSLVCLSHYSSKLVDKGNEMRGFIQKLHIENVGDDAKVELDLLLFHLNSEPVVLTIWKMIPLYKSIIISVFVSIITYFTVMISF